ncbi:MAG: AEC family transporter [Candidatus Izemoplasmatales bacterium]
MSTLLFALNAVLPILLLIGLGYFLKKVSFINENFLSVGNKFVFTVALPTLLFYTTYTIDDMSLFKPGVIVFAVCGILFLFIFGLVISKLFIKNPLQKGVIVQGIFRANYAIIGIPLAEALGGAQAVAVVAIISVFVVPLMNVLAVIALVMYVKPAEGVHPMKSLVKQILLNPLIIATVLGLISFGIQSMMPRDVLTGEYLYSMEKNINFLYTSIKWIAQIASPLALVILGGTFEFFVIKEMKREISIGVFSRVVLAPLITLSIAVFLSTYTTFFSFSRYDYPALIALYAAPSAVASAIMAKQMNNDASLAVQLVVWSTSLSIISVFFVVLVFKILGIL